MSHVEGYSVLGKLLKINVAKNFRFLDLACGDAYYSSKTLKGTSVKSYTGLDITQAALNIARDELSILSCEKELVEGDLFDFTELTSPPYDVIWLGFSLHHFETTKKAEFMKMAYDSLTEGGMFIIYEPIYIDGEDRAGYNRRIQSIIRSSWSSLNEKEIEFLLKHIRETELPETMENWTQLGKDAGFSKSENLYIAPSELYGLFRYKK